MTYSTDNSNDSTVYDTEPDEVLYDVISDDYGNSEPIDDEVINDDTEQ